MTWQKKYCARLLTVADVDAEIDRVQDELWAAHRLARPDHEYKIKLRFLGALRDQLSTPELAGLAP